ncbi:MAG: hypothetical protein ABI690_30230 [Chloroflexota bacterium]
MMPFHEDKIYVEYKQRAMLKQASEERLAQMVLARRRIAAFRFYYRVLAGFGHWLVVSGSHLQKRYGDLPELSKTTRPMPSKRQA